MNGVNALIAQGGGRLPQAPDLLGMQRNVLINQRLGMENVLYPEKQRLDMRATELDNILKEYQVEDRPLVKEMKGLTLLQALAGSGLINSRNFPQYKAFLTRQGMNPIIFQGVQPGDEQGLQEWLSAISTSTQQRLEMLKMQIQQRPYKPGQTVERKEKGGTGTYRITGYTEKGMPTEEQIAFAPTEPKEEKGRTEEQLTRLALAGDKEAQAELDAMQKRRLEIAIATAQGRAQIEKPLPSEMVVAEQQLRTIQDTLRRVYQNYKPDYVGPIGGRIGMFKENWIGIPEQQASFYADLAQINNTLIYLMSGKQINEMEYKRLKKQLPSAELPVSVFMSRMDNFEKTVHSIIENRRRGMSGYRIPATAPLPPATQFREENKIRFQVGNKVYAIPKKLENDFLKDFPNAQRME